MTPSRTPESPDMSWRRPLAFVSSAVLLLLALAPAPAHADENLWGYLYGSDTLPKGRSEVYVWWTNRVDKADGEYRGTDIKFEVEHGFSDRFQMSLYLNSRGHHIENVTGLENRDVFGFDGMQVAFKYAPMSVYKDPFGLALYFEPGYSHRDKISGAPIQEWEYEAKVIAQKNFAEDRLALATNLTLEQEFEREEGDVDFEGELVGEWTTGLSYRFAPGWHAGVELRAHTEFPDMDFANQEHAAWFAGPNLHYGGQKWWATVTVLPQIGGWPHEDGSKLHLEEHERLETRLKLGVNL